MGLSGAGSTRSVASVVLGCVRAYFYWNSTVEGLRFQALKMV